MAKCHADSGARWQLRTVRRCPDLHRMIRQPLAVDVDCLHGACPNHQEQARKSKRSQPQWVRVLERAAFKSFGQVFRSVERSTAPISSSMTQIRPQKTPSSSSLCPNCLRQRWNYLE
jgi:hypothetical protein